MVVSGYVALKIHNQKMLHYADWTNTQRIYHLHQLSQKTIFDLRRLFNGKTTVLLVNKKKTIETLTYFLKPLNVSKCIEVPNTGIVSKILTEFLSNHNKKKSYYNYQREHWLSIISVINIHIMLNNYLSKRKTIDIISKELKKYNRNINPQELLDIFLDIGLYITKTLHNEDMVSIPDNNTARTLG